MADRFGREGCRGMKMVVLVGHFWLGGLLVIALFMKTTAEPPNSVTGLGE
jgi:hypothetical protein